MASSTIGTLRVDLFLNMAQFIEGLDKAPKALAKLSRDLTVSGRGLTKVFTVPLAGLGAAAVAAANVVDEAMDNIRASTGATGAVLKTLEADFKAVGANVPASLENVGMAVAELNKRLGLTGKPLQDMAAQELELARLTKSELQATIEGTTKVFGKFEIAVGDQGAALDTLFKVTQKTGIGLTELTGNLISGGSALREMGFGLTQSAVLLGQFSKLGVDIGPVLQSMKKGVIEFSKAGLDSSQAFAAMIAQVQNAKSMKEGMSLTTMFFGARGALEIFEAIKQGRFQFEELSKAINDSKETIMKAAKETMSFGEQWILLKNNVTLALEPLGKELLNVFQASIYPALIMALNHVKGLARGFSDLEPITKNSIIGMGGIVALAGPLVLGIAAITASVANLTKAGAFLFATPWGLAILGISAAVASGYLVWEKYSKAVKEAGAQQQEFMAVAHSSTMQMASAHERTAKAIDLNLTSLKSLTAEQKKNDDEMKRHIDYVLAEPQRLEAWADALDQVWRAAAGHAADALPDKLDMELPNAIKLDIGDFVKPESIKGYQEFQQGVSRIQEIIAYGWENVGYTIERSFSDAFTDAMMKARSFRDGLKSVLTSIRASFFQMIGDVLGYWVHNLLSPMLDSLKGIIGKVGVGGTSGGGTAAGAGGGILSGLSGIFKGTGGVLGGIGNIAAPIGIMAMLSGNNASMWGGLAGAGLFGGAGALGGLGMGGILAAGIGGAGIGAAVALAVSMIAKAFTNTPNQAAAKDFGRDFGGVKASASTFSEFLGQLGLSEKQAKGIHLDLLSSPKWLTEVAYPLAQQQGKVSEFLKSLESIKTVMGTFNFRAAFETGMKSGDFAELNRQFVEAFKDSKALVQMIPDFAAKLTAATDGAIADSLVRTRLIYHPVAIAGPTSGNALITGGDSGNDPTNPDLPAPGKTFVYAPNVQAIDAASFAEMERTRLFPDFMRHVELNIDSSRDGLRGLLGTA